MCCRSGWLLGVWEDSRSLPFPLQDLQPSAACLLSALLPVYTALRFGADSETAMLSEDTAGSWVAQLSEIIMGRKGRSLFPGPCHCGCPDDTCFPPPPVECQPCVAIGSVHWSIDLRGISSVMFFWVLDLPALRQR